MAQRDTDRDEYDLADSLPPSFDKHDVQCEMLNLLQLTPEVDVATIYRAMVGLFGAGAVPAVSENLAALLRDGTIVIDTRSREPFGPLVGHARLSARVGGTA